MLPRCRIERRRWLRDELPLMLLRQAERRQLLMRDALPPMMPEKRARRHAEHMPRRRQRRPE